ncbi:hypothetical protein [Aldersonia kunmingensis]|uniref:hypothetical protein n=1 Tax=Aldersonia kunmingensis TaxID=408066 RepID=UPI0012EE1675|nr:hypothetical protein [Aldersonia kunmingensis]
MRIAAAAFAASATALVLFVSGCSDDEPTAQEAAASSAEAAISSAQSTAQSLQDKAGEMWDDAKVSGFVTVYRATYSTLAEGKSDEEIKAILVDTCGDISDGKSEAEVKEEISKRAENNGDKPSDMQVNTMYIAIKPLC